MANRRMFSLSVVNTDKFLDMPASSQNLYFHLGMRADDDGFVSSPKRITKLVNCGDDDLRVLLSKGYLIPFDDGVVVIRHWNENNYIRSDRYHETIYIEHKNLLSILGSAYELNTDGIPNVHQMDTEVRLGEVRLDKDSIDKANQASINKKNSGFTPPTLQEVNDYCHEKGLKIDPSKFIYFYESKGWMVGKNKMKSWRAACCNWDRSSKDTTAKPVTKANNMTSRSYNMDDLEQKLLNS